MARFLLTVHAPPASSPGPVPFGAVPTAARSTGLSGPQKIGIGLGVLVLVSLLVSLFGGGGSQPAAISYPQAAVTPYPAYGDAATDSPSSSPTFPPDNLASLSALKSMITDFYDRVVQGGTGYVVTEIMGVALYRTDQQAYAACVDYRIANPDGSEPGRIVDSYNLKSDGGWQVTERGSRYDSTGACESDVAGSGGILVTPPESGPAFTPAPVPVDSSLASLSALRSMITTYYDKVAQGSGGHVVKRFYGIALYKTADQVYEACTDLDVANPDGSDLTRMVRPFIFNTNGGWRVVDWLQNAPSIERCEFDLEGQGGVRVTPPG